MGIRERLIAEGSVAAAAAGSDEEKSADEWENEGLRLDDERRRAPIPEDRLRRSGITTVGGGEPGGGGGGGGDEWAETERALQNEYEKFLGIDKQRARDEMASWLAANPGKTEGDYWTERRLADTRSDEDRAAGYASAITDEGPLGGLTAERQFGYEQATIDDLMGRIPGMKQLAVDYAHEDVDAYLPESSAYSDLDPGTREAQMRALGSLEDVYSSDGMTAADAARMQLAQQETGSWLAAQQAANMAQSQARGIGGSGLEIAGGLSATQQGAQSLGARDLAMQVQAQDRALQAMQAAGGLAGEGRRDDQTTAGALDDFNMDVSRERRGVAERNVDRTNLGRESRSGASKWMHGARERGTAMRSGQYQGSTAEERDTASRNQKSDILSTVVEGTVDLLSTDDND